jgi:hypothetical protein
MTGIVRTPTRAEGGITASERAALQIEFFGVPALRGGHPVTRQPEEPK